MFKALITIAIFLTSTATLAEYKAKGVASWYGPGFDGRKTASGERFNRNKLTVAHRSLEFNTLVRITNLNTNKSVVTRVTDRGPFVRGRIVDLSQAAARAIGIKGTALVEVMTLN